MNYKVRACLRLSRDDERQGESLSIENQRVIVTDYIEKNGYFMGTFAPYGYVKNPDGKLPLLVDEKVVPIIKRIFEMRASGMGYRLIAEIQSPIIKGKLLEVLSKKKPYRNFKDKINYLGISKSYYSFRAETFRKLAKEWCIENQISYDKT